jgi:hypothetical protein
MLQSSSDDLIIFISSQRKMSLFLTLTFNQKSNHHSFFHYCDINNKIKHVPREEIILILTTKNDLRRTTSSIFLATQGTMSWSWFFFPLIFVSLQHSFFKQFYASVTKSDYITLRLGFIMVSILCKVRFVLQSLACIFLCCILLLVSLCICWLFCRHIPEETQSLIFTDTWYVPSKMTLRQLLV